MPFKSEKQRKWMHANDPEMAKKWEKEEKKMKKETKVRGLIRKMVREVMSELNVNEDFAGAYPKGMRKKFDKMRRKQSEVFGFKLTGVDDVRTEIDDATIKEAKERNYKEEYKKFQSSTKSKKYRAELNAYNRKKGTYGNGDGKDASHKGGKIVGYEKESVNRGRAEKSRLKKEGKLSEVDFEKVKLPSNVKKFLNRFVGSVKDAGLNRIKRSAVLYKVINAMGMSPQTLMADITKIKKELGEGKIKESDLPITTKKGKTINLTHKTSGKEIVVKNKPDILKKYLKLGFIPGFAKWNEGKLTEAKETIFDVAARVMKDKQAYKYKSSKGQTMVDMQTANLLTKVWKKISPKMKKHLTKLGHDNPTQLVKFLWSVVK